MMSISNDDVAKIGRLGITRSQVESIMTTGTDGTLTGLVQIVEYLDIITGSDDNIIQQWMTIDNSYLKARPIDLIQQPNGIEQVVQYLAMILRW